jgi:hypothetical protein
MNESSQIDFFYDISLILTGYNRVKLNGTGQGELYFSTVKDILGKNLIKDFLSEYELLKSENKSPKALNKAIQTELFKDPKWGPVCKNIIKLWYMGKWYKMPTLWRENYTTSTLDEDKIITPNSYKEGLVWEAVGQHPPSAKQPGYGTWAFPPKN